MLVAWWLQKRRVVSFWPYILAGGVLSWIGFYRGGVHPALALVPIIPFLPHAERDPGLFVEAPDAHDTLDEFEHRFKRPVDVMLFFFGLVNAGVVLGNVGAGTWFVLISIIIGKPARHPRCDCSGYACRPPPACARHVAGYDGRRHHRRHRLHRRAVLRDRRLPVRPAAGRNEARRAAELRRVLHRARCRASVERRTTAAG